MSFLRPPVRNVGDLFVTDRAHGSGPLDRHAGFRLSRLRLPPNLDGLSDRNSEVFLRQRLLLRKVVRVEKRSARLPQNGCAPPEQFRDSAEGFGLGRSGGRDNQNAVKIARQKLACRNAAVRIAERRPHSAEGFRKRAMRFEIEQRATDFRFFGGTNIGGEYGRGKRAQTRSSSTARSAHEFAARHFHPAILAPR